MQAHTPLVERGGVMALERLNPHMIVDHVWVSDGGELVPGFQLWPVMVEMELAGFFAVPLLPLGGGHAVQMVRDGESRVFTRGGRI
jgi:hypothetical protein